MYSTFIGLNKTIVLSGEQSLWDGLKRGNVQSLEALYTQYNELLYNYGKKFTTDIHLVQDAIQETFISLWKYRTSISADKGFNYYLLKSFRNQLLRLIKERANTTYTDETLEFSFEVGFDKQLIAGEEYALLSKQVKDALGQLTARQREIIYFRFFEGLSFEEIAGIMNMQVRATYKLTSRALAALKEIMSILFILKII
ncbi:sigma-70 family RNA polymerase sigma factor [Chitinophaga oryziterrae]|uniref:Sigma-70 family RNA polymerase sigma factor n=1 Tax=Chitinophaga oryziterrae TaxID=1031224 RepID=A0A6N8J9T8_9BACT|nr:sigma-70 family RNA polymerase sigma factor [Chitinophaga oryziterrae]MVT41351.1 sigma-70 family RNA polymerase sigma factor [Chitinophaga oryziterrae]